MTVVFIGLGLIIYLNLYTLLLKILKVKSSLSIACIYALLEIFAASIAVYISFKSSSKGELIVYLLCIVGAIVRAGYAHLRLKNHYFNVKPSGSF